MLELKSCDKFHINNRGDVFSFYARPDLTHGGLDDLEGCEIKIDGEIYIAKGIERFSLPYKRTDKVTTAFSILVENKKEK